MKRKGIRFCISALAALITFAVPACAQPDVLPGVRSTVQRPLHAALILTFKEKNIKAALAKISEAEAIPNKTPEETTMISVVEGTIDQVILQRATKQHVTVSPAEVDARIAELRAENELPALSPAMLRNHITAEIAWINMGN